MRQLLVIETREAAEQRGPAEMAKLAQGMARLGVPTTIFLTENGAFNARRGEPCPLDSAISDGVQVRVDGSALTERGISADELRNGVSVGEIDLVVDHLVDGSRIIWR